MLESLNSLGITRAGDLTDLDTIGIPVWFAVRPNSRCLSVSQGKGLTHEQARLSAMMEAAEGAFAEQTKPLIADIATPARMAASGRRLVPLENLARCRFAAFDPDRERAWVRGIDHATGEAVFTPYELVGLDMRPDFPWDHNAFAIASNGLAAGPDFAFAAVHAVRELIERDATAAVDGFGFHGGLIRPLGWEAGLHAGLDEAVGRVRAAGLTPHFFHLPSPVGLPVLGAIITRPVLDGQGGGERLSGGYACDFDAGSAALGALLEAVQSRLTNIAGSRDDLEPSQYETDGGGMPAGGAAADLGEIEGAGPDSGRLSSEEKLALLAAMLSRAGYPDLFLFDLPGPVPDIHVVRALVPGLRAFLEGEGAKWGVEEMKAFLGGLSAVGDAR